MNKLFRGSSHLAPYVTQVAIKPGFFTHPNFLRLRGAAGFIERCPNIRALEIDVHFGQWTAPSQDFVISKLKSVENLMVRGMISGQDLEDILHGLPALRSLEIHPREIRSSSHTTSVTLAAHNPSPLGSPFAGINVLRILLKAPTFDSSNLIVLKLGWTIGGDPSIIQVLKEFTRLYGNKVQRLTLFGVLPYQYPSSPDFGEAITSLRNVQDLTVLMSLSMFVYYRADPVAALLFHAHMAPPSTLRNVTLSLVSRIDDTGSNADWGAITSLLCNEQRFPNLCTVNVDVKLLHNGRNLLEKPDFYIATTTARIQSCMLNLTSSGKLRLQITVNRHSEGFHDPVGRW
ncbi:hypothetical protein D9758_009437 [Tetrapyrgos nigripes]|uniref:Uncharacterized protein n=1 Tax=Tetrapyrgos nigripes TaxID=182062 RepID=A0A8H5D2S7_9AGAR|nr:hypothetical protein D9758_009437 [Tetrapyrgos nigripes]